MQQTASGEEQRGSVVCLGYQRAEVWGLRQEPVFTEGVESLPCDRVHRTLTDLLRQRTHQQVQGLPHTLLRDGKERHTRTHTHKHTHTHTHTHAHRHVHTHTHTPTDMYTDIHTPRQTCRQTHTHRHTLMQTQRYTERKRKKY